MTVTSGFFNALEGTKDRAYNANHFNVVFDGIITPGILLSHGDALLVYESSGMNVLVGSGKAWFNSSWIRNDAPITLSIAPALATLYRKDLVVMDFDKRDSVRENKIIVLTGASASSEANAQPPTLIDEEDHVQKALAQILITPGMTTITNSSITNLRGTAETPFATSLLETIDSVQLLLQWDATFWEWFNSLPDNVDDNVETQLLARMAEVERQTPIWERNLIINGGMTVAQRGNYASDIVYPSGEGSYETVDRWYFSSDDVGMWDLSQEWFDQDPGPRVNAGYYNSIYCSFVNQPAPSDDTKKITWEQKIKSNHLKALFWGTPQARHLTLSFLVRASVAGTYIVELENTMVGKHICRSYTIDPADVNQDVKINLEFPPDYVDPLYPSGDEDHLILRFWITAGTNFASGTLADSGWAPIVDANRAVGQVDIAQALNNSFSFTNVLLEPGRVVNDFVEDPDVLERCRGWYDKLSSSRGYIPIVTMDDRWFMEFDIPRYMDGNLLNPNIPEVLYANPAAILDADFEDPPVVVTALAPTRVVSSGRKVYVMGRWSPGAVNNGVYFGWFSDPDCYLDAELY